MGADNYEWRFCGVDYSQPSYRFRGPAWDRKPEMHAWKVAPQAKSVDHRSDQEIGGVDGS